MFVGIVFGVFGSMIVVLVSFFLIIKKLKFCIYYGIKYMVVYVIFFRSMLLDVWVVVRVSEIGLELGSLEKSMNEGEEEIVG